MNADKYIKRINELQAIAYLNRGLNYAQKVEWNSILAALSIMGFRISKRRSRSDGGYYWCLRSNKKRENNFDCEMLIKDMSPDHKHLKGNCTTRSLAYVLLGTMTYDEIEREQYALADSKNHSLFNCGFPRKHYRRNSRGVWERVLTSRGWKTIMLNKTIRRDKITNLLKETKFPVITVSSHHASVSHNGKCVDTWDCRKGRVRELVVSGEDFELVNKLLDW